VDISLLPFAYFANLGDMPIRRFLRGSAFNPEEVRELGRIYREIITALSLKSASDQQDVAKAIMLIASKHESFDPGKIHDEALQCFSDKPH
jgi:hypothetical protein